VRRRGLELRVRLPGRRPYRRRGRTGPCRPRRRRERPRRSEPAGTKSSGRKTVADSAAYTTSRDARWAMEGNKGGAGLASRSAQPWGSVVISCQIFNSGPEAGVLVGRGTTELSGRGHAERSAPVPPGPGAPWWGMQGGDAPLPAGGLAVERCLKESVSERGRRAGCPQINPPGSQSER